MGYLCDQSGVNFCTCDVVSKNIENAQRNFNNIADLVKYSESNNDSNVYFVCVPTPSKASGECDTSIVESVLQQLHTSTGKSSIVYIKSTVEPGTSRRLSELYGARFKVVFCPEFLRELTHLHDMYNANFVLLGTPAGEEDKEISCVFKQLYKHKKDFEIVFTTFEESEMFKNTINVFLAVKVWYFNKIHQMSSKIGFSYENLKRLFRLEPRIGESHTSVPGHDGLYGFGGSCLPKETRSLCYMQNKLGLSNKVLSEILYENDLMRLN